MPLTLDNISVKQLRIAIAGLLVVIVLGICNIFFSYQNYVQRQALEKEIEEFKMQRTMLDARARIQMILIEAVKMGRPLTADEIRTVDRLFIPAQYDIEIPR